MFLSKKSFTCREKHRFSVFYSEVMNTLERAEEEDLDADNIVLEINSLK